MSSTIAGYQTSPVTLGPGGTYVSPVTISGTINSVGNYAITIQSPWTVSLTGAGRLESDAGFGILADSGVTLDNAGYIRARTFDAIFLNGGGTIKNEAGGTIAGGLQGVYSYYKASTTIINAGYIRGRQGLHTGGGLVENLAGAGIYGLAVGVTLTQPVYFSNAGLIQSGQGYAGMIGIGVELGSGGSLFNSGTIIGYAGLRAAGGTITNDGLIEGEVHDNTTGLLLPGSASAAVMFTAAGDFVEDAQGIVLGSVTGDGGTLEIYGGTLAEISGFAVDSFAGAAKLGGYLAGFGTIAGFGAGDTLHIDGMAADAGIFSGNAVTLSESGAVVGIVDFAGTYESGAFAVHAAAGGTDITVACFCAGTQIATPQGAEMVEALQIGDWVRTLHAGVQRVKWIGTRSYDGRFIAHNKEILPICITRHAIAENVPARDLFVSPGHAICIDGALIHAFRLINGVSITQSLSVESLTYYHVEMESHEVIFAENCAAETFIDERFRAQFENVAQFRALYPGQSAGSICCLPRLEDGFLLDAVLQRLAARAGVLRPRETLGALHGYVDEPGPITCSGWAQDLENPETPVCLDIVLDGNRIARVLANRFRADLRQACLGSGCHAFRATLPSGLTGQLQIRRTTDGAELPWTEAALAHAA